MFAVVRTGGKQYRVEEGTTFLVERLTADEGATVGRAIRAQVDVSVSAQWALDIVVAQARAADVSSVSLVLRNFVSRYAR